MKSKIKVFVASVLFASLTINVSADDQANSELKGHAAQFQAGLKFAREGDLDDALKTWNALSETQGLIPQLKRALQNNIAVIYIQKKEYDMAKLHLDSALKADTQIATTIENLNKLYAYDAQKAYKKVFKKTEITPPNGEFLFFDVKGAEQPNQSVIMDVRDIDSAKIVKQMTEGWRKAWSQQEVGKYLSFYDLGAFIPKNGMTIETWKKGRQRSLSSPKFINIETENLQVSPLSDTMMRVSFYQKYHSDRFKDDIQKVLLWKKRDNQWRIVQEVVVYAES